MNFNRINISYQNKRKKLIIMVPLDDNLELGL